MKGLALHVHIMNIIRPIEKEFLYLLKLKQFVINVILVHSALHKLIVQMILVNIDMSLPI